MDVKNYRGMRIFTEYEWECIEYQIEDEILYIEVIKIGHRKDIYR